MYGCFVCLFVQGETIPFSYQSQLYLFTLYQTCAYSQECFWDCVQAKSGNDLHSWGLGAFTKKKKKHPSLFQCWGCFHSQLASQLMRKEGKKSLYKSQAKRSWVWLAGLALSVPISFHSAAPTLLGQCLGGIFPIALCKLTLEYGKPYVRADLWVILTCPLSWLLAN